MSSRLKVQKEILSLAKNYAPASTEQELRVWVTKNLFSTYLHQYENLREFFWYAGLSILYVPSLELFSITKLLPDGSLSEVTISLERCLQLKYGVSDLVALKATLQLCLEDCFSLATMICEQINTYCNPVKT